MKTLSSNLTTLSGALLRPTVAAQATIETFYPEWVNKVSGGSPGQCHGHAAAVAPNGNGAGEDVICRARSGSTGSPTDGKLYVAFLAGADLETPASWDSLWVDSGITGLMHPLWSANTGAAYGGSIAVVWSAENETFRIFVTKANGDVAFYDFSASGSPAGSGTVASLGTSAYTLSSMQIAACHIDELYLLTTLQVESGYASWHKPIYGSCVRRYTKAGGVWSLDSNPFYYHTHAEGHLLKDNANYDAPSTAIETQWGMRPCGGLAVNQIDANTVCVSYGQTYWRRWGYQMNNQSLMTFTYYRDSGIWRRGPEAGAADYLEDLRLHFDTFARGSSIEGRQFVIWNQASEPTDIIQTNAAPAVPRPQETVIARFSVDGKHLTQFINLGDQDEMTAASVVVVHHEGTKLLYALGWRGVMQSEAAAWLCSVPADEQQDLGLIAPAVTGNWGNRWDMGADLVLAKAGEQYTADTRLKPGNLVRVSLGGKIGAGSLEFVQMLQGYVDQLTPSISLAQKSHRGKLVSRADKFLLDTAAETIEDILPQNLLNIPPDDPLKNVARHAGRWNLAVAKWPAIFFSGQYPDLVDKKVLQLQSTPPAFTGGGPVDLPPGVYGGGGACWDAKPADARGTWYRDVLWMAQSPTIDGSIQATVRMGDNQNHGNFSGDAKDGCPVAAQVIRQDGQISHIKWSTPGCNGQPAGVFDDVWQWCTVAGVIAEAVDIGRKYSFLWETSSNLAAHTHQEDQAGRFWNALVFDAPDYNGYDIGTNRLYLMLSDFDTSSPDWQNPADRINDTDWQDHQGWIHKVVAGGIVATGLTPGKPADLKMTVMGGQAFCFYRPYPTGDGQRLPWRYAFQYKLGRFGAGRKGIVGRGDSGIHWDVLWPFRDDIKLLDNYVDFWDVKLTDGVEDQSLEDVLAGYAWQGFTETEFRSVVKETTRTVTAGSRYMYSNQVENICLDFDLTIAANDGEAGVILKANSPSSPQNYITLGLTVNSTYYDGTTRVMNCQAVKRRYAAGVEVDNAHDYSPSPIHLKPGVPIPCRVTVRGTVYSIWVGGNLIGHFIDETQLSWYFGLYAIAQNATFQNVHLPELYEVPEFALLDVGQKMADAMRKVIDQRRIKGVFQSDGALLLSYFTDHDVGPTLEGQIIQNTAQHVDRFISAVKVEGAYTNATYVSPSLSKRGRRFSLLNNPNLMFREHCLREAKAEVRETAERMELNTMVVPFDLRIEPEDQVHLAIDQQDEDRDHLVEGLTYNFKLGYDNSSQALMQISTRLKVTDV